MKYIANILTETKFPEKEFYNIVKKKEELIDNLPTLVIGWKFVNQLFDNVSVLDWKIDDNLYWTFGRRERGERFEEDVKNFEKIVINRLKKNVKYIYFNVLTENTDRKKDLFEFLKNDVQKNVYIENDVVFFCKKNNTNVFGISLNDVEYEGLDKSKFLSMIFKNGAVTLIKLSDFSDSDVRYQLFNLPYMIPYLYG